MKLKSKSAFTLIEMVLVMGLLTASALVVLPFTVGQLQKTRANDEARSLASNIFVTQQDAFSGLNNSAYGIAFFSNRYEVYAGTSLASSTAKDIFYLPNNLFISNINFGGSNELKFNLNNIRPVSSGSLYVSDGRYTYLISINREGLIEYTRN